MFSDEEGMALVNYMKYMGNHGFPMTRSMVRKFVLSLVKADNRVTLFNLEKGPSDDWFKKFLIRHPELSEKQSETQDRGRNRMSNSNVMEQHFKLLEETLDELGIKDKPGQIFNCDETGWSGKEKSKQKVFGVKGQHCYQQSVLGTGHITAHLCISANGTVLPSFLIFEKSLPHTTYKEGVPGNWRFAYSESGYMDTELFINWFKDVFIPNCGTSRPVLLVMDNHDSHISMEMIRTAQENNITLFGLPAHTTHLLQPLDVHINGPLKATFNKLANSLGFINKHQVLNKAKFPAVLSTSIDKYCSPANVKESLRKCGIYPFNPDAIDKTQLTPTHNTKSSGTQTTENTATQEEPSTSSDSTTSTTCPPSTSSDSTTSTTCPPSTVTDQTTICKECGTYLGGNPLVTEGLIPEQLSKLFPPIPAKPLVAKRKMVTESRIISSAEFLKKLEEKDEEDRKKIEGIARRKREREEKRQQKEEELKQKAKKEKRGKKQNYLCNICKLADPVDGEGDTTWVQCELCDVWYHPECVGLTAEDLDDEDLSFKCVPCLERGEE